MSVNLKTVGVIRVWCMALVVRHCVVHTYTLVPRAPMYVGLRPVHRRAAGLRSVEQAIGTRAYPRLRLGIGAVRTRRACCPYLQRAYKGQSVCVAVLRSFRNGPRTARLTHVLKEVLASSVCLHAHAAPRLSSCRAQTRVLCRRRGPGNLSSTSWGNSQRRRATAAAHARAHTRARARA